MKKPQIILALYLVGFMFFYSIMKTQQVEDQTDELQQQVESQKEEIDDINTKLNL